MARTRAAAGSRGGVKEFRGRSLQIPGLYARLLEHKREVESTPDPQWRYSEAGQRGEPCPAEHLRKSLSRTALEAGDPVQLPGWCFHAGSLGSREEAIPGFAEKRHQLQDRSIADGWLVYSDDTLVPWKRAGR